jgi:hypothetical protein
MLLLSLGFPAAVKGVNKRRHATQIRALEE